MRRIFIYIILILSVAACKTRKTPSEINIQIPEKEKQLENNLKNIVIRIDREGHYYLNKNHVIFDSIIKKIDALGNVGFNASTLLIHADKDVKVSEIIKIMDLANNNTKNVKLIEPLN